MVKLYDYIVERNKELGGTLVRNNSLKWACSEVDNTTMTIYRQCSIILRSLVVDHPFTDFNKSTSILVITKMLHDKRIDCDENLLVENIFKVAKKNITDIDKILRMLRRCCQKEKKD